MFLKNYKLFTLGLFLWLGTVHSFAAEQPPLDFVKTITNAMIEDLNVSKVEIKKNPSLVLDIVDRRVIPYVSKETIARKVMGRVWKDSSEAQRTKFVEEFTTYLKRFYSKALLSFDNQSIEFSPDVATKGDNLAMVSTKVIRPGQASVEIKYKLAKGNDGWKVTDLIIEGISLVINNQRQYSTLIVQEGLDAVTAKLAYNNQQEFK
ncbi:MAG: hypothetical protein COW84_04065 [Gammaproteobacteria bacterium CG22_combo_CG10-13_8_21_14_all_40_8]|nr:MAG: hypothetical protein COW84_04065 [Gammaproteobacteria bacterium CG22_combo_CG10-13_8_21_14_all_40_8]